MKVGGSISGALFVGVNRSRRVALWRIWGRKPALLFIGLNPSTAAEKIDDPTIRRVARFARENEYGGLFVGNLFDQVTRCPERLNLGTDQTQNDEAIKSMREYCAATLVGWGNFGDLAGNRPAEVLALIGKPVYCLGKTKDGWPRHPLYIRADQPFIEYEGGVS
jgi:hypothetical protein